MNWERNILKISINTIIAFIMLTMNVYAKCSKKDIDYYLDKGFTTEQVTALCSEEPLITNSPRDQLYRSFSEEYADEKDEAYIKKMRIERQVFLRSAIGAQQVKVKGTNLSYNSELCGRNAIKKVGATDKANIEGCAIIRTIIDLSNIEVSKKMKREKILMGTKQILVTGKIEHKIIGGLTNLTAFEQKMLKPMILKKLRKNEARIPIKRGLDFTYALENFNDLVDFHKGMLGKKYLGKGLGGKLDVDDLKLESQNDYINEKEDDGFKFSNEKDESIDGALVFDDLPSSDPDLSKNSDIPEDVFN